MFSPMVAIRPVISSPTVSPPSILARARALDVAADVQRGLRRSCGRRPGTVSLRATKSVSALSSIDRAGHAGAVVAQWRRRPGPRPRRGRPSWRPWPGPWRAASRSPPRCRRRSPASAFLQSIMPAPVVSRRSFTMAAVMSAMVLPPGQSVSARTPPSRPEVRKGVTAQPSAAGSLAGCRLVRRRGGRYRARPRRRLGLGLGDRLGARPPASGSGSGARLRLGRRPARPWRRRARSAGSTGASAAPMSTPSADLAFGQAVEHRVGDQVAVELQRAGGVVVARDREG